MKQARLVISILILAALLALLGIIWDIHGKMPVPDTSIGIMASGNDVMVEAIAITGVASGGGELYGFITTTNRIYGWLEDITIDYTASISATTDVTITHVGLINETLLVKADNATDAVYRPRVASVASTGSGTTYDFAPYYLQGTFLVNVGQTSSATPGTVYIRYRR